MSTEKKSKELFEFAKREDFQHDQKFETRPIGYLRDAMMRFTKNRGSVVAGIILLILIGFALLAPVLSSYRVDETATQYKYLLPKNKLFEGTGFWDGTQKKTGTFKDYTYDKARGAVVKVYREYEIDEINPITLVPTGNKTKYYDYRVDSYIRGFLFLQIDQTQLDAIKAEEVKTGKQMRYPLLDTSYTTNQRLLIMHQNANYYYKLTSGTVAPVFDANGDIIPIYMTDPVTNELVYETFNGVNYMLRVDYDMYYTFINGKTPSYLFGSDEMGRDVLTRLAVGARLSILLGFSVAFINILIGVIYGSIEGYYGGTIDLVMERISDILVEIPSMIVLTLFQVHLADKVGPIPALLFAFVLTGWIGTASRVRMQFYRYKRQEYVLAARTLGASDRRIIFRHILPNAIGTIITGSILMVPSVIFSESTLSFLGIVDLSGSSMTSIGAMLNSAQSQLSTNPHVLIFPALFISLLMIAFNVFGNGLRDAFNPTLRGVE